MFESIKLELRFLRARLFGKKHKGIDVSNNVNTITEGYFYKGIIHITNMYTVGVVDLDDYKRRKVSRNEVRKNKGKRGNRRAK